METLIGVGVLVALVVFVLAKTAIVVPQQNAFVVEMRERSHVRLRRGAPRDQEDEVGSVFSVNHEPHRQIASVNGP